MATAELTQIAPLNPLTFFDKAIERNADPDQLEKLLNLYKQWTTFEAEKAFNTALHRAQSRMPRVVEDAVNPQTKSRYALLETVQTKCTPIFTEEGFSLTFGEADCPIPDYKRTICDLRHKDGHWHQYHIDLPIDGIGAKGNPIGGMNPVQGCISTTSYGQRRLICMIGNLVIAGEDTDGGDPSKITSDQIGEINDLIEQSGANIDAFFEWIHSAYGAESLDTLPTAAYVDVIGKLKKKIAKGKVKV